MPNPVKTLRVRAAQRAKLPARDGAGNIIPGRWLGRDRKGEVIADGVDVPATSDVLRAIARGDLLLVEDAPAAPAQEPQTTDVATESTTPQDAPAAPAQEV